MNRQATSGIWKYSNLLPTIDAAFRLTLAEGGTPLKKIHEVYIKCEYKNPTGSVKDRAAALQVSSLYSSGKRKAAISSSGNAAISVATYCQLANIDLMVYVTPKINQKKLQILQTLDCSISKTVRPLHDAFEYVRKTGAVNLRQSTDPNATAGYRTIAYELHEQCPDADAVFLPVSSGATCIGIADGYSTLGKLPAIHVVQTQAVHPVSVFFNKNVTGSSSSLADAIIAKYTPLRERIIQYVKLSRGSGWVVSDEEIRDGREWLLSGNIDCSYEGAAAYAAYVKSQKLGFRYKNPVLLLTGRFYPSTSPA